MTENKLFNKNDFKFFIDLITEAGALARDIQVHGMKVSRKDDTSIVTQADLQVQDLLIEEISKRFTGSVFVHEENFDSSKRQMRDDTLSFIIDPIDGTAMYSMHLPIWCISIGVFRGYSPLYGFVFSPGCGMLFHNDDDHAYLNGHILEVDKNIGVDNETNIFIASEIPRKFTLTAPGKIRNLGSSALHASLIADNRRNRSLAFIGQAYLWDWAGSIPVILKAGGQIKYLSGRDLDYREIVNNDYKFPEYVVACSCEDFNLMKNYFVEKT